MPEKRSNGGGPTAASRSFADELYKEREQQQLGSVFHVVGSLRNWTSQWSEDVHPTPRVSDSTTSLGDVLECGRRSGYS